jgi:hypothetical protein
MRRRRLLLGAGLLALFGAAAFLLTVVVQRPGSRITRENYERIDNGMTEEEVNAVLGCVAGDYTGKKAAELEKWAKVLGVIEELDRTIRVRGKPAPPPRQSVFRYWIGDDVAILVYFIDGKVFEKHLEDVADQPISVLDRLRRLLPW